jgi:hypothetical protein
LGEHFHNALVRHKLSRTIRPPSQTPLFPLALPPPPVNISRPSSIQHIDYHAPQDHQTALNSLSDDPGRKASARQNALDDAQELMGKLMVPDAPVHPEQHPAYTFDPGPSLPLPALSAAAKSSAADASATPSSADVALKPSAADASPKPSSADAPPKPSAADASFKPSAADASFMPSAADASFKPSAADASFMPSSADASFKPSAADASFMPSSADASIKSSAADASFMPSSADATLKSSAADASPPQPSADDSKPSAADAHLQPSATDVPLTPSAAGAPALLMPRKPVSALIADILRVPVNTPGPSQFKFQMNIASATHNGNILQAHNYDLASAIRSDGNSPLSFGSEFRPVEVLKPLLGIHPLWPRLEDLLLRGSHFSAEPLPNATCLLQATAALDYGNHKGATKAKDKLCSLLNDDVTHGFNLPLPLSLMRSIPGLLLSPMNIVRQNSIDAAGNIVPKDRLTHDHSMDFMPKSSINSRSNLEDHEPCHFGHALLRFFHRLVHLRMTHPSKRILMTKVDWKAAYRRCHLDLDTARQCCTHLDKLLLFPLRLTFGGAPAPPEFSCLSDTGSDIANDLVNDDTWDPLTLCSPHQAKMPPVPSSPHAADDLPHPAQPLLFDFPKEEAMHLSTFDNFIDDQIAAGVDIGDNVTRLAAAGPLALHAIGRPLSDAEPIPRDDNLSLKKFAAEALPEETKVILGWLIDAWLLTVSLPQDKYLAWSKSIRNILFARKVSYSNLEELIGRLNHLCRVIQPGSHFMGRLRSLLGSFSHCKYASRHIDSDIAKDLHLWLHFMKKAATGVSLNILVLRVPTHMYRCDASFHGIGGYSSRGRAWRYDIPVRLRLRASINLLEFIGSLLGPWIDFVEGNLPPESSVYSQGDNTTAASWLQKTNFSRNKPAHLKVARRLANLLLEANVQLANEWIEGICNLIADSLSRDTHLSIADHTALLHSALPQQMPDGFKISPLPAEISSWVGCILQLLPASPEPCPPPTRSKLEFGTDGSPTSAPSTAPPTPTSSLSTLPSASSASSPSSSAALPRPFEQANFKHTVVKEWLQARSKVTSDRWYKPSGLIAGKTQPATPTADYPPFYLGNTPASRAPTLPPNARKPSACASSSS